MEEAGWGWVWGKEMEGVGFGEKKWRELFVQNRVVLVWTCERIGMSAMIKGGKEPTQ